MKLRRGVKFRPLAVKVKTEGKRPWIDPADRTLLRDDFPFTRSPRLASNSVVNWDN